MELIAAVLLAGACAAVGALALRRRRRECAAPEQAEGARSAPPDATVEPTRDQLEQLHLQDVVLYDGMELTVAGIARCDEHEQRWCECRLVDAGLERWLVIRPQDPDAALWGGLIEDLGVGAVPSESLEHGGQVYRLERCGHARLSSEGDLGGALDEGDCQYWDYRRPGLDRLWIRRGAGAARSFGGQRVGRHLITVLPGT